MLNRMKNATLVSVLLITPIFKGKPAYADQAPIPTEQSLDHLKSVAEKHELHHRFRPRLGGPLYEIWIESQILVEFVSDEIRNLEP